MAVDYPLFEITQQAKSASLALRGTVHNNNPIAQKASLDEKHLSKKYLSRRQQRRAYSSLAAPSSVSLSTQVLFFTLIGGAPVVYAPEELEL